MKIKLGILGVNGKMGKSLSHLLEPENFEIVYEPTRKNENESHNLLLPEVIIDFSSPDFCLSQLKLFDSLNLKTKWIIGSTGWTSEQLTKLESYQKTQCILKSANFSLGVFLLRKALEITQKAFKEYGFECHMTETHHIHKKDKPSGTALLLAQECNAYNPLHIESVREGEVIGFHEVCFESELETVKMSHDAKDRIVFAKGALEVAKAFLKWDPKEAKINTLDDLFSLKKSVI